MSGCIDLVRTYNLRDGLRVEFAMEVSADGSPAALVARWYPEQPAQIDAQLLRMYRQARQEFMGLVSAAIGGRSVLVVEV